MKKKATAEEKAIRLERKARKLLMKRLHSVLKRAEAAADKQKQLRKEKAEKLSEYKTYDEALDAYGWDIITEDEFEQITKALEDRDKAVEEEVSPDEVALHILSDFVSHLARDIHSLEWDLLSDEKKEEVRQHNEEIRARREARLAGEEVYPYEP